MDKRRSQPYLGAACGLSAAWQYSLYTPYKTPDLSPFLYFIYTHATHFNAFFIRLSAS